MRWFDAESIGYPGKGLHRGYLDGREPEKLTGPAWAHLTLSSGNRFVGDNDHTSIYTRSFQSTNFTEIFRFPDKNVGVDYTVWSPDGKFMLFDRSNPQGGDIYYLDGVE